MKDSKKFSSKKKICEQAEYIKAHCIAWSVQYIEPDVIDDINIRQAVFRGMHSCIRDIIQKISQMGFQRNLRHPNEYMLLVDGNDFKPFTVYDDISEEIRAFPHETIEGGDNKYTSIAAASILAKVSHDEYIAELCQQYPVLTERYNLDKNVGYGTKAHMEGIQEYGITQWHRKTFGQICKNARMNHL
jgi:ribonuclease HII